MLNLNTSHPDHAFHERVCQYRAKLILHKGFKQYRETFGDSVAEIAEYLGWTESKLRQVVYHNFYARKTEDIILLCRLFQCDVDEATRPYHDELDCDLAIDVMEIDDEKEARASNVEPIFPVESVVPSEVHKLHSPRLATIANKPVDLLSIDEIADKLTDQEVCTLVSIRAEKMSQHNLLELTKDLMMLGMTRGSQAELPLPDFE